MSQRSEKTGRVLLGLLGGPRGLEAGVGRTTAGSAKHFAELVVYKP